MARTKEKHDPIQQSVHVDCPVEDAFRLFTERFGEWWPADSENAEAESREIEPWQGGKITERTPSGEERELGTVTAWEPPRRLEFTWHPGTGADRAGKVEVEFTVEADGTRVTLIHHDWHLASTSLVCFAGFAQRMLVAV
jgi:uncharacterized protein YndB with AHSA1/START domain